MPAFINSGHFFPPLAERDEEWVESRNSGATFNTAPAPYQSAQVIGPDGSQRFETTFTIPATANGTFSVTVQGDIFAGEVNTPAHVFYDGVDLGPVNNAGDFHGPTTFTIGSIPGVHTFSLRIGGAAIAGVTAPHIGVTYNATQPCCCILNPSPPGPCYMSNNFACFAVNCADGIKWYFNDGVQLTPDDIAHIVPCTAGMQGLRLLGGRLWPANASICSPSIAPSNVGHLSLVGSCWVPTALNVPTLMEWDGPLSSITLTLGDGIASFTSVLMSFAIANEMGLVGTAPTNLNWPFNGVSMKVGESRLSNPLPNGHRVSLTYVAGPNTGAAPASFNDTSVPPGQGWILHAAGTTSQVKIRLTYI